MQGIAIAVRQRPDLSTTKNVNYTEVLMLNSGISLSGKNHKILLFPGELDCSGGV